MDNRGLPICPQDTRIMIFEEQYSDDMFCLLIFSSPGNVVSLPIADGPDWKGLAHGRGIVWDPGIVGLPRLRLCCDCLCLIPLFRDVLLFVCGQTDSSARFLKNIGDWRTIIWKLRLFGNDILSLQCVHGTPVGPCVWDSRVSVCAGLAWVRVSGTPVCPCARDSRGCHYTCGSRDPGDWAVGPSGWLYGTFWLAVAGVAGGVAMVSSNWRAWGRCRLPLRSRVWI